jgi:hypothetical protein
MKCGFLDPEGGRGESMGDWNPEESRLGRPRLRMRQDAL